MSLPKHLRGRDMGRVNAAATEEHRIGQPTGISGKKAVFRQVYLGSRLPNVDRLEVDGVHVHQLEGPVEAREVFIQQLPTPERVSWAKAYHQHAFGIGALVTLADLHVTVDEQALGLHMGRWSKQCSAALGLVAACLDERATYRLLVENLIVYETDGSIAGVADVAPGIRTFGPFRDWDHAAKDALEALEPDDALRTACRWFLRAVVSGPGETGMLWLATTIESLVNEPGTGKPAFDVKRIHEAFQAAGGNETELPLGIGRCAGLRAQIVHKGTEEDENLRAAWYSLETVARTLLRDRFAYSSPWPLHPGQGAEELPWDTVIERHFLYGEETT